MIFFKFIYFFVLFSYRMHSDAVVGFICETCGVTCGVPVLIPGLDLQRVLLPIDQDQGGEMISDFCFGWNNGT